MADVDNYRAGPVARVLVALVAALCLTVSPLSGDVSLCTKEPPCHSNVVSRGLGPDLIKGLSPSMCRAPTPDHATVTCLGHGMRFDAIAPVIWFQWSARLQGGVERSAGGLNTRVSVVLNHFSLLTCNRRESTPAESCRSSTPNLYVKTKTRARISELWCTRFVFFHFLVVHSIRDELRWHVVLLSKFSAGSTYISSATKSSLTGLFNNNIAGTEKVQPITAQER